MHAQKGINLIAQYPFGSIVWIEKSVMGRLKNKNEESALKGLLDSFGSVASLRDIASAYCKAGGDPDLAGQILFDNVSGRYSDGCDISVSYETSRTMRPPIWHSVSAAAVSSVTREDCTRSTSSIIGSYSMIEPPQQLRTLPPFRLFEGSMTNNIKEPLTQTIGNGHQMVGMTFTASLEYSSQLIDDPSKTKLLSSERKGTDQNSSCSNVNGHMKGVKLVKERKLSFSPFKPPERPEEMPGRARATSAVKRSKLLDRVVAGPPVGPASEQTDSNYLYNSSKTDEDDKYTVLRKAVKEYRTATKEYYKAAVEAFARGKLAIASKLIDQGYFFLQRAREVDDESAREIFQTRDMETQEDVSLHLHDHTAKEVVRLLKHHLLSLAGIPSIKHLKVVMGKTNAGSISQRTNRQVIINLLDKESITWIEAGDATNCGGDEKDATNCKEGEQDATTLLIRVDNINPEKLSFNKGSVAMALIPNA